MTREGREKIVSRALRHKLQGVSSIPRVIEIRVGLLPLLQRSEPRAKHWDRHAVTFSNSKQLIQERRRRQRERQLKI